MSDEHTHAAPPSVPTSPPTPVDDSLALVAPSSASSVPADTGRALVAPSLPSPTAGPSPPSDSALAALVESLFATHLATHLSGVAVQHAAQLNAAAAREVALQARLDSLTEAATTISERSSANAPTGSAGRSAAPSSPPSYSTGRARAGSRAYAPPLAIAKKSPATLYQMKLGDHPDDSVGFKKAFILHLRILWNLLELHDIPPQVRDEILRAFSGFFGSDTDLRAARNGPPLVPAPLPHLVSLHHRSATARPGTWLAHACMVEEHILEYMQTVCARYGITDWCPDIFGTPYSRYNAALRIIAIDTFKQAMAVHAYSFLAPNPRLVGDTLLLTRLYDHFIFHFQLKRVLREVRQPGSLAAVGHKHVLYVNRKRLADARLRFAKKERLPERYYAILGNPAATSDDELDTSNGTPRYIIKQKIGRSANAEHLIRAVDRARKQAALYINRPLRERERILPSTPIPSQLPGLPLNMPVDYFAPGFFNMLPVSVRRKIIGKDREPYVALPLDANWILAEPSRHSSERLSTPQFMARYGDDILEQYNTGYESEYEGGDDEDEDEDEEDDMEVDDDELMDLEAEAAAVGRDADLTADPQQTSFVNNFDS